MKELSKILSEAQASFNDYGHERFKEAEMIDHLNHVLTELARDTEVWISRKTIIPNPLVGSWDSTQQYALGNIVTHNGSSWYATTASANSEPTGANAAWLEVVVWDDSLATAYEQGDVVIDGTMYYIALSGVPAGIDITDEVYWRRISGNDTKVYKAVLPYEDNTERLSPYKLIAVYRRKPDTKSYRSVYEFTVQSVARTHSTGFSFDTNTTQIYGHAADFLNTDRAVPIVDGSLALTFTDAFDANEQVVVDYIQGKPIEALTWDTQNSLSTEMNIPDFMSEAAKMGLIWRLAETAFMKGDNNYASRADRAKIAYIELKDKAISYARKFKNKSGTLISQPHDFFLDGADKL